MSSSISVKPFHVVIIPDGNRRWARLRNLPVWEGHEKSANNIEHLIRKGSELGITHFSFWGSSLNNLKKRPLDERRVLLDIYTRYFRQLRDNNEIHDNKTRISVFGCWEEQFPEILKKDIHACINATKNYHKKFLNFFLAYNGDEEMLTCIRRITQNYKPHDNITFETIKNNLYTKDLPPVDLLIRTGGEPHLSTGFMMWDIANTQLYFSDKLCPDFLPDDLEIAISEYYNRERRHGQ